MTNLVRGRIYGAVLQGLEGVGEKYFLVVSNNQRNKALDSVLAVRLTATATPALASIVEMASTDAFSGQVVCDDIVELWPDEIRRDLGAVTHETMRNVGDGLRAALTLL